VQYVGRRMNIDGSYGPRIDRGPFSVPVPGNHHGGARTVPKAGRAGAAGLGAALRDAAAAPEGGSW